MRNRQEPDYDYDYGTHDFGDEMAEARKRGEAWRLWELREKFGDVNVFEAGRRILEMKKTARQYADHS